jgi:hypothetical protein
LRPFGDAVDLDLDFAQPDRPGLVTSLLTQCSGHRDGAFWWSQPVGVRIAALLRLVALTEQRDDISLSAACTAADCGEAFGFELPLDSLRGEADTSPRLVPLNDGRALTLRRPTGNDLRGWRDARPASRPEAVRLMISSLVLAGEARPEDEATLSALMTAMDPLVAFTVSCNCPTCGAPIEIVIDLETLALRRLSRTQDALLQEVHQFASHYGWTEVEVLAVPSARRARYLALIAHQR